MLGKQHHDVSVFRKTVWMSLSFHETGAANSGANSGASTGAPAGAWAAMWAHGGQA